MKLTKRNIVNKLQSLGIELFQSSPAVFADMTWMDTGRSIQIDLWSVDFVIPCKYDPDSLDAIPATFEILYRKDDCIHANAYDHCFKDIAEVSFTEFMNCRSWIELKNLVYKYNSRGLKLVA